MSLNDLSDSSHAQSTAALFPDTGTESTPITLIVVWNGGAYELPLGTRQMIGRIWGNSIKPDVSLPSPSISRMQAEIFPYKGALYYRSFSKNNTTYCNAISVSDDPFALHVGDVIRIRGRQDPDGLFDAVLIFTDDSKMMPNWRHLMILPKSDESPGVLFPNTPVCQSGKLALQMRKQLTIEDRGADGGVFLNNRQVKSASLTSLDVVCAENTYFVPFGDSLFYQAATAQSFEDEPGLQVQIDYRRVRSFPFRHNDLLRDIQLRIPTGKLVLILGGSGAGKTTFINAVMGYEPANGKIEYKGIDIYKDYNKMKYEIGYVQQEDLLRKNDTVYNTILDAAQMHLPNDIDEQRTAVMETLKLLGLEKEKDKLVGQLSGGQRKRLSIGVEYVGEPSLFFLDEPDSGLDGSNADNMWEILRKIADTGKIVMVISHIPDRAFDQFDRVLVLAKDQKNCGRLAFSGSPREACEFFGTKTLEAIVKRINRVNEGGEGRADEFIARFEKEKASYEH